jgi:hypothetical protein
MRVHNPQENENHVRSNSLRRAAFVSIMLVRHSGSADILRQPQFGRFNGATLCEVRSHFGIRIPSRLNVTRCTSPGSPRWPGGGQLSIRSVRPPRSQRHRGSASGVDSFAQAGDNASFIFWASVTMDDLLPSKPRRKMAFHAASERPGVRRGWKGATAVEGFLGVLFQGTAPAAVAGNSPIGRSGHDVGPAIIASGW